MFQYFGFSGEHNLFKDLGHRIDKGMYIILASTGTILLGFGSAYAGSYSFNNDWSKVDGLLNGTKVILFNPIAVLIIGAVLFLFGAIGTYRDQENQNKRMARLEADNEQLNETKNALNYTQEELQESKSKILVLHTELVTNWLKIFAKNFDLSSDTRITIYYEHDEEFYLLARHSKNPVFAKIHRQKFPLNQGVISKAWEHETHVESECPNSEQYDAYVQYLCTTYNYDREKIDTLTMKSCRYIAKAIIDADTHIGVIVFESTSSTFLDNDMQSKIENYCATQQGQLSKFVRDSIGYDKEVTIKRKGKQISVEDEMLRIMGN